METRKFYNYIVFENGDIYSNYYNRLLKPDITKHGYKQITLFINNKPFRIKVHILKQYNIYIKDIKKIKQ